jgi:integrase/recombinase XerD
MKNKDAAFDSNLFWRTAKDFVTHYLRDIRRVSENTIIAYRDSINKYIDYLEVEQLIKRRQISFSVFDRKTLKEYMYWMLNSKNYAKSTCNLRLSVIHSLLEYAAYEHSTDLMAIYQEACTVKCFHVDNQPIEYFEDNQMKELLSAPTVLNKIGRRNQMMLILYYDTAARISELIDATVKQLHLDSDTAYITLFGKGRKYRNVPLMDKTVKHLKRYLKEFHSENVNNSEAPLFYATTYGKRHHLSRDTIEKMIKQNAAVCISRGTEMPKKVHCHMIRKTRAMNLYRDGVPLTHIQQILGHKNLSTTSGFYVFATLETLSKSLKKSNKTPFEEQRKWDDQEILKKLYRL